jgi:hypothetical protein
MDPELDPIAVDFPSFSGDEIRQFFVESKFRIIN